MEGITAAAAGGKHNTCQPAAFVRPRPVPLSCGTLMSDPAAALRQRASECEQKAALTIDETHRRSFLELARAWRKMAADYEELIKKQAENSP